MFYLYLAFHTLSGSQGLARWVQYENDIGHLNEKLVDMNLIKVNLQARRDRLSASHLDLDDLDIKARQYVFVSEPDEITVWLYD